MAASPRKQLALDANVLLDLAEGQDFAHDFREQFQTRGYEFLLSPTTVAELNILSIYGGEPQKTFANRALHELRGSVRFSIRGRQLEIMLATHFKLTDEERDFASPNYHSEGNRKWRNHLQFVRDQLVKKGQLSNARHGYWTISVAGYKRLGVPPQPGAPDGTERTTPITRKERIQKLLDEL